MERYQMNRSGCRAYPDRGGCQALPKQPAPCACQPILPKEPAHPCRPIPQKPEHCCGCNSAPPQQSMYHHADQMIPAMGYVPFQQWQQPYNHSYALQVGTIFPALCKPFCGRRGTRRC